MKFRHTAIAVASLGILAATGLQAQQAPDPAKPNPSAATSTGTSTPQSEMNRGVPGVNVDVGRNSPNGVISGDVDRNTDTRNVGSDNGTTRTPATNGTTRAPRADRG